MVRALLGFSYTDERRRPPALLAIAETTVNLLEGTLSRFPWKHQPK